MSEGISVATLDSSHQLSHRFLISDCKHVKTTAVTAKQNNVSTSVSNNFGSLSAAHTRDFVVRQLAIMGFSKKQINRAFHALLQKASSQPEINEVLEWLNSHPNSGKDHSAEEPAPVKHIYVPPSMADQFNSTQFPHEPLNGYKLNVITILSGVASANHLAKPSESRFEWPESGLLALPDELLHQIFKGFSGLELIRFGQVCTRFWHHIWNSTIWKSVCKQHFLKEENNCGMLFEQLVSRVFQSWRHMAFSLMKRRRKCKLCHKEFYLFTNVHRICWKEDFTIAAHKKILTNHEPVGFYVVQHPLEVDCLRPSEQFRRLREFLQKSVPHEVSVQTKWKGRGNIMLRDLNTDVMLFDPELIMAYLSVMYSVSSGRQQKL